MFASEINVDRYSTLRSFRFDYHVVFPSRECTHHILATIAIHNTATRRVNTNQRFLNDNLITLIASRDYTAYVAADLSHTEFSW